jgi:ABC-type transport system substrate-binding protein
MSVNKKVLTTILIVALAASMIAPLTAVQGQSDSLFSVTIIAPGNANLLRRQWSQIFASNLKELGIDAKVVYLDWTPVYDRVFTPSPDNVGKTYDEGGFDYRNPVKPIMDLPHSLRQRDKTTISGTMQRLTLC